LLTPDELDMRIIRELGGSASPYWNVWESYSAVSRKLGVDEETVRTRINRARERGFLPAWRVMVNPMLIGCLEAVLDIEVREEQRKVDAVSKVRLVDGVYYIDDFRGRGMLVGLYHPSGEELARKVRLIESICGSDSVSWERPVPRPNVRMRRLDWQIIEAMGEDAWRDLREVAKATGVSTRTIQRRLAAMKEGKAIYLSRPPNVSAAGGLMCNFLVRCDEGKKRAADYAILSAFNRIGASDTSQDGFSIFGMSCQNYAEADAMVEKLRAIEGVVDVRLRVLKEIIVIRDWLEAQVAMRAREG